MTTNSFLFVQEPRWKINRQGFQLNLPSDVASWVYEAHSLTQRLRSYYGNHVRVKILYHQWRHPFVKESFRLNLDYQHYALIREVLLYVEDKPLLLARTVLPKKTIQIAKRNLSQLGTRPLGEVIFSYPHLERLESEVCCVPLITWSLSLKQQFELNPIVWGRRTVYAIQKQPLLVSEFFLPDALKI